MTTTTPLPIRNNGSRAQSRGFTLVEVMISAGLSALILAGVLSSFLFLGRTGAVMQNYNTMESQSRYGLEKFAEDVRQASAITWNTNCSLTLKVNAADVTYTYTNIANGKGSLSRTDGAGTRVLITGTSLSSASANTCFAAYDIGGGTLSLATADLPNATLSTKQVQISLTISRSGSILATATNNVLSARFILRNKPVTA